MPSCPLSTLFFYVNSQYIIQHANNWNSRDQRQTTLFLQCRRPSFLVDTHIAGKYFQNTGIIFWFVYRMKVLFKTHQIHFLKGEMFQLKLMGDDCLFPAAHKSGCSAISNIPGKEAGDFLSMF